MSEENNDLKRLSRRNLLKAGAAAGVAAALPAGPAQAAQPVAGSRGGGSAAPELTFVNGRIHTMDDDNSVVSSVAIRDGRFVAVGNAANPGPGSNVVNLHGRTVVPGIIESHTHFVSLANRPGYHVAQWELASNVAGVLAALAARRAAQPEVPPGQFITAMGGGNPNMANRALYPLRIRQSFDDKKRSALDAMAFSASVGITTVLDQTLVAVATGTLDPASLDPQPTHPLFTLNHYRMYDAWRALHREGKAFLRLQINFLHNQGYIPELGDLDHQLPELRERLKNQFFFYGDDMLRTGAIGEWAAPFATPSNANGYAVWYESQRLVAKAGWRNENAQGSVAGIEQVVSTYEAMDREFGIRDLRWGLQAVDLATPDQLARLKVLNCGVSMSGFRWLNGVPRADGAPVGPLFPQIIASGIPAALHEDGVHIAPHNPWFAMHYATTGLNVLGQQINAGQQITRQQALHGYTRAAAWYLNRENEMGSIEVGKFADLVVLDRDYFSVSDAQARQTRPVLTVVDGKIAYDAGAV